VNATALSPAATVAVDADLYVRPPSLWRRFRRHKVAVVASIVLIAITLVAIFAKFLPLQDPSFIDQDHWSGTPLAPGVAGHLLGTDENGRDLLARLVFGAQISLTVAGTAVLMEVVIGSVLGAISGFYGGLVDYTLMRVVDVFASIPILPLLLVLSAIVSSTTSKASLNFIVIIAIIGLLSWPSVARLVRASFLSLREKEFAEAARAVGNGDARIIFRHLLPNAIAPIIVQATLDIASVIVLESTLSFLGFGVQPPTASWGNMLSNAQSNMANAPWVAVFPGLCIFVTVLAINYIGDGLRDALDPNMK